MRATLALGGISVFVATALGIACSGKAPVGLMLAIQTDLSVTKDFDQIGVYVTADGAPILTQTYPIEGGRVRLPSTIAVAVPKNETAVIRARVVAFKTDSAKVLREGITTVPSTRLAVMPLPLKWLNVGSGKGTEAEFQVNPFAKNLSVCPDQQNLNNGICTTSIYPVDKLADYVESEIFGGGEAGGGECFETKSCFAARVVVPVDEANCTVNVPTSVTNIGVGTDGDGEPVGPDTIVVLDGADYSVSAGKASLPKTLCDPNGLKPKRKAIFLSTSCATKTSKYPICGPYSTGKPQALLGDAGVLDAGGGPLADGGVEQIGASEPGIGAVSVGSSYIYGIGADPNDGGTFRLVGYPLAGVDAGSAVFVTLAGPPPNDPTSTALVVGTNDIGVLRASPVTGTLERYTLQNGVALPSPASAGHPLPVTAFAASPTHYYTATGFFDVDAGGILDITSFPKSDVSAPNTLAIQLTSPVYALAYATGAPADGGPAVPYLYVGEGSSVMRISDPDGSATPVGSYVASSFLKQTQVTALAVSASGSLVIGTVDTKGTLTVYSATAFSSAPAGGATQLAAGLQAPSSTGVNGVPRFYGVAADGKYAYYAHAAGIDYAPLDGSAASKSLVQGQGIFTVTTDSKYLYWAAARIGNANPATQGFFRLPLVP